MDREEGEGAEYPEEEEGDGGGAEWVSPLCPHLHLSFPLSFHYYFSPLGSFFLLYFGEHWEQVAAGCGGALSKIGLGGVITSQPGRCVAG